MELFWSWGIGSLPLCTLPLRFRVILVDPCFITCDDTAQNIILPVQNVLTYFDSSLHLYFGGLLWDYFCTHLPHVNIFSLDFPNMFTCSARLLTVNRRFSCTICGNFAIFSSVPLVAGRPELSSSWTLRKTFHPLLNCCCLHSTIPVNLH